MDDFLGAKFTGKEKDFRQPLPKKQKGQGIWKMYIGIQSFKKKNR